MSYASFSDLIAYGAPRGSTPRTFEVYCHTSPSGKRYVGITRKGVAARLKQHARQASRGADTPFCRAIRKYGAGAFRSEVLAHAVTESEAMALEIECIAAAGSLAPAGYNSTVGGDGVVGKSLEVRAKLSAALRGVPKSPEHCARIGDSKRGLVRSPEHCAKIAAGNRGKVISAEQRKRIGEANAARVVSSATREKMSAAKRGQAVSAKCQAGAAAAAKLRHARNRFSKAVRTAWLRTEADLGVR